MKEMRIIESQSGRPSGLRLGKNIAFLASMAVSIAAIGLTGCASASESRMADTTESLTGSQEVVSSFDADSAYSYVEHQVIFGPRVPNTDAHRKAGDWLATELRRHGAAEVIEQPLSLRAFDGTLLKGRNIMGRYNPEASSRLLLLAHWDCRPWADEDKDPAKRKMPVDGANDGASGVGVLLEIARQLGLKSPSKGVDILFVDAEDWGSAGDDDSWALGTRAFAQNPPVAGYPANEGILLDMVGGKNAVFCKEYFSQKNAAGLNEAIWERASRLGYASTFLNQLGSAINDDHLSLIDVGIPTIDIIEYNPANGGFNPNWHTSSDNMDGISAETLGKVGTVVMTYIREKY